MSLKTLTPLQRAKVRASYPEFTRKLSRGGYRLDMTRVVAMQPFKTPGSPREYVMYEDFSIRRVGGRVKTGRNAPGYRLRRREERRLREWRAYASWLLSVDPEQGRQAAVFIPPQGGIAHKVFAFQKNVNLGVLL